MSNTPNDVVEQNLIRIIADAPQHILHIAKKKENPEEKSLDELKSAQWKHRRLSQAWVKYLGRGLEKFYREDLKRLDTYAFPGELELKTKLGIKQSEFLFDVSVGSYKSFKSKKFESSKRKSPIYYQSHSIWQIESEFAEDTREVAIDFSKLFAGNADYAMMVGPSGKEEKDYYMNEMKKMQRSINTLSGKILYFLILPHPRDWTDDNNRWKNGNNWYLYKWDKGKWMPILNGNKDWVLKN